MGMLLCAAIAAAAAFPAPASGGETCLILLGCRQDTPVVKPPPPGPAPASPCAAQPRRGGGSFVGLVSEDVFWDASSYRGCNLNDQAAIGVALLRQTFDWARIEVAPGSYDFSWYDAWMAEVARRRMRVLPIVFNSPRFRARGRRVRGGPYLPRRTDDFGRFAARLARRYGPRGAFWRARPDLPRVPIRAWQVWNEPNLRVYWPARPDPRAYTRLLAATAKHVERVDRGAEIVTAGIADSDQGVPIARFVEGMYRAGAARAFDTLAVNAYAAGSAGVPTLVRRARRLMDRHGDRRAALRVTEFGWASGGPSGRFTVSRSRHAGLLSRALRTLYAQRRGLRLKGVVYFNWRDAEPYPPLFRDFFGLHTGLLDASGRPKPAYHAFRSVAPRMR